MGLVIPFSLQENKEINTSIKVEDSPANRKIIGVFPVTSSIGCIRGIVKPNAGTPGSKPQYYHVNTNGPSFLFIREFRSRFPKVQVSKGDS